jgi:AraC-like DNA-binding protein
MTARVQTPNDSADIAPATNPRMVAVLTELARGEGFMPSRLPGVRFMRSTRYVPRSPIAYEPGIFIVAQGRKSGHLGDQTFIYDANNYLVLAVPLPFECETFGSVEQPVLGISISVSPALVSELLMQMDQPASASGRSPQAIESAALDTNLSDAAVRLLEALRATDSARILGPQLVREITYRVLLGSLGGNLRALASPHSHFGQIGRVLSRIHTEFAQAMDMETLARDAGMSLSTFHAHFKAATSSSPLQYLKAIRLHKARMLMVHDGVNAGTAAHQVGYESVSQFSREFKRLFGASPTEAVGALRASLIRLA